MLNKLVIIRIPSDRFTFASGFQIIVSSLIDYAINQTNHQWVLYIIYDNNIYYKYLSKHIIYYFTPNINYTIKTSHKSIITKLYALKT